MTTRICDICNKEYEPFYKTANRKYRPQRFCSKECRKVHLEEYLYYYLRNSRIDKNNEIKLMHKIAHKELRNEYEEFRGGDNDYVDPRIDINHDSWDVIPGKHIRVGTITSRDLAIITHHGQKRVLSAVKLFKNKKEEEDYD